MELLLTGWTGNRFSDFGEEVGHPHVEGIGYAEDGLEARGLLATLNARDVGMVGLAYHLRELALREALPIALYGYGVAYEPESFCVVFHTSRLRTHAPIM